MTARKPLEVLVLAGGLSHERDVSLRSGRRVALALRSRGVEVVERAIWPEELESFESFFLTGSAAAPPAPRPAACPAAAHAGRGLRE